VSDTAAETVLYEVALVADAGIEREFDTWLRDHVADMLALPGFLAAELLTCTDPAPAPGQISRTVQYRLRDRAALDEYLTVHAPRMREHGQLRFGDRFSAERRTLVQREEMLAGRISTENCLNCGEVLSGQYCSYCGQRAKVRVISLWELTRDVIGDLFELDSRIWRTLRPLVFRPGFLTAEYLRGRRVQYTPPFRMYLVISVIFFLVVSLVRDEPLRVQFDGQETAETPEPGAARDSAQTPAAESGATTERDSGTRDATQTEPGALEPAVERAIAAALERVPEADRGATRAEIEQAIRELPAEQRAAAADLIEDPCAEDRFSFDVPGFEHYEPRARAACRKIVADSGASFGRALWENIPKMMFIFLPVMVLVNKFLYIGSRRYYVEHLLFFVHFHAFFFCVITVDILSWRLWPLLPGITAQSPQVAPGVLTAAIVAYVPFYLYRAMRRVYEQGRVFTLLKFMTLIVAYLTSLVITFLGVLAYTALTL
jgi:hypothetical protein